MVLARMLRDKQYAEEFRKGVAEGRRQRDKEIIAWAKEKGVPFEDLPIESGGYLQDFVIGYKIGYKEGITEGIAKERRRKNGVLIAWAKEKGIPIEDLPLTHD